MKYRVIKNVSIILLCLLVIAECLWLYDYFWAPLDIEIDPEPEVSVNCNNYSDYSNRIDYRNGRFGFLSEACVLTITDGENEDLVFRFVNSFVLSRDCVLFVRGITLYVYSFSSGQKVNIGNMVDYFATDDTAAYYLSHKCVYRYCYESGVKELIAENVDSLILKDGYLLFVKDINTDSSEILKINTNTMSVETVCVCDENIYGSIQLCGDYVISFGYCDPYIANLSNGEVRTYLFDTNISAFDISEWRCSDNFIYLSYLHRKNYKPLGNLEQRTPFNGLWRINPQTFEKEKISDIPFSYLFVVSDEEIYGIYDEGLYKINAVTKTVKKVSNEGISAYLPKVYT